AWASRTFLSSSRSPAASMAARASVRIRSTSSGCKDVTSTGFWELFADMVASPPRPGPGGPGVHGSHGPHRADEADRKHMRISGSPGKTVAGSGHAVQPTEDAGEFDRFRRTPAPRRAW